MVWKMAGESNLNGNGNDLVVDRIYDDWLNSLREQRHDFMNDLQVLLSYFALGKNREGQAYIREMASKASAESKISQLGYAPLSLYLLLELKPMAKLNCRVEMEKPLKISKEVGQILLYRLRQLVEVYHETASGYANQLWITFSESEGHLHLMLEYEGRLSSAACLARLRQMQGDVQNEGGSFVESLHNDQESVVELIYPIR